MRFANQPGTRAGKAAPPGLLTGEGAREKRPVVGDGTATRRSRDQAAASFGNATVLPLKHHGSAAAEECGQLALGETELIALPL